MELTDQRNSARRRGAKDEEGKLSKIITDADAERLRQRKEFDAVIAERDMLGTQLIRRNNEVKGLYEKIKIVRSTLTKGEWTYEEKMDEHQFLVDMIEEVRRTWQFYRDRRPDTYGNMVKQLP